MIHGLSSSILFSLHMLAGFAVVVVVVPCGGFHSVVVRKDVAVISVVLVTGTCFVA